MREILTLPEDQFLAVLQMMSESKAAHGIIARTANAIAQKADRERSSVISSTQRQTAFLDDPHIVDSLKRSEVDFDRLKIEPMTVYIVLPQDQVQVGPQARFVRALIHLALQGVMRVQGMPAHPVVFLLDEFAALGRMPAVEGAISMLAGHGGLFWILVQDLSQLQSVYDKWGTFFANSVLQAFATQDLFTLKYLSEHLGSETIVVQSSSSSSGSNSSTESTSTSAHGRPLMMPDEIRRMQSDRAIVLIQGQPPYLLRKLNYLTDPDFAGQAAQNPMYSAARLS